MMKPWPGHRGRSGGWGMATVVRGMFSCDPNKAPSVQIGEWRIRYRYRYRYATLNQV